MKKLRGEEAKAEVIERIRLGYSVAEACRIVGLTRSAETYWCNNDEDYKRRRENAIAVGKRIAGAIDYSTVPDFPEFCEKYMHQRLYPHQLQWFDMLEGRPPRDMHPSCVYEPGNPKRLLINTPTGHALITTDGGSNEIVVISGATSGANPPADLNRVFFLQLSVVGSTMGTLGELHELERLLDRTGVRPIVDRVLPMSDARAAFAAMVDGDVRGKLVLTV